MNFKKALLAGAATVALCAIGYGSAMAQTTTTMKKTTTTTVKPSTARPAATAAKPVKANPTFTG
jgi:predicted phage gp36 major capsid-like protein